MATPSTRTTPRPVLLVTAAILATALAVVLSALVARPAASSRSQPPAPAAAPVATPAAASAEVRYPDVPASACAARSDCVPFEQGALARNVQTACGLAPPLQPGGPAHEFTLAVAGMTGFCQARHIQQKLCAASCTLRFRDIDLASFQQRAEDVAQAIRDQHGRELGYSRSEIEGQKQRRWQWRGTALALGIVADWRPLPAGSQVPSDIHLDFMLRE